MAHLQSGEIRTVRRLGLLHIQAEVFNPTDQDQQLTYRFKWFDEAGLVLGEEAWKPVVVHRKQKQYLQTVAPSPQVADFKIEMFNPEHNTPDDISSTPVRRSDNP